MAELKHNKIQPDNKAELMTDALGISKDRLDSLQSQAFTIVQNFMKQSEHTRGELIASLINGIEYADTLELGLSMFLTAETMADLKAKHDLGHVIANFTGKDPHTVVEELMQAEKSELSGIKVTKEVQ